MNKDEPPTIMNHMAKKKLIPPTLHAVKQQKYSAVHLLSLSVKHLDCPSLARLVTIKRNHIKIYIKCYRLKVSGILFIYLYLRQIVSLKALAVLSLPDF